MAARAGIASAHANRYTADSNSTSQVEVLPPFVSPPTGLSSRKRWFAMQDPRPNGHHGPNGFSGFKVLDGHKAPDGHNTAAARKIVDERRAHPRYHFTACVAAIDVKYRTTMNARTSDISRGGCYVDAFCPFPVNADVKLRLSCEKRSLIAKAKVVCSKTGMGMGLEFRDLEEPQLEVLDEWLGELSGARPPKESETCEAPWEAESELAVDRTQWYVLHELVVALMRKSLLGHQEGKAMLRKLLEEDK